VERKRCAVEREVGRERFEAAGVEDGSECGEKRGQGGEEEAQTTTKRHGRGASPFAADVEWKGQC